MGKGGPSRREGQFWKERHGGLPRAPSRTHPGKYHTQNLLATPPDRSPRSPPDPPSSKPWRINGPQLTGASRTQRGECGLWGPWTACRSPRTWLLPACPGLSLLDVPKFPCDLQRHCPALASASHLFTQGSRKPSASRTPHPQGRLARPPLPGPAASAQAALTPAWPRPPGPGDGPGRAREPAAAGAAACAPPLVFVTDSVFKARPGAAARGPFLCLGSARRLRRPPPRPPSQAAPRRAGRCVLIIWRRQFQRHLNSDVNELIRCVNELKAAQIKLMQ